MRRALLLVLAVSCTDANTVVDDTATAIDVTVQLDPALAIDQLRISGTRDGVEAFETGVLPSTPRLLGAGETFAIVLREDLDGASLLVRIDGLAAGAVVSSGGSVVTVRARDLTRTQIALGEPAVCGDAIVRAQLEACDDANTASGDGCSASCFVEDGWTCTTAAGPSTCTSGFACSDGVDNDGDGAMDGADPGCSSVTDADERGTTGCDNAADDDGDGRTDFSASGGGDPGCTGPADNAETGSSTCDDGVDNDSDGRLDFRIAASAGDPGCDDPIDSDERGTLACDNAVDDDGDGFTDFSLLAGSDPGCSAPDDLAELGTATCDDGVDNDNDGGADYPGDAACTGPSDDSEKCTAGVGCPDCDDGEDNDGDTSADFRLDGTGDPECTSPVDSSELGAAACADNIDNDGDGLSDLADPGCTGAGDPSERGTTACDDGLDNDGDGAPDFGPQGGDDECSSPSDTTEFCTGGGCSRCEDGMDNDADGLIDFRIDGMGDAGCASLNDNTETCAGGSCPECDNGNDDGDPEDNLIDAMDPGCSGPLDDNEVDGA